MSSRLMSGVLGPMLIVTTVGAVGQVLLKIGMGQAGDRGAGAGAILRIMVTQPLVFIGLTLYALNTILYLSVLQKYPLSLVFPMIAFSYVLVAMLAWGVLGERISGLRAAGLMAIVVGVLLMAYSSRGPRPATPDPGGAHAAAPERASGS